MQLLPSRPSKLFRQAKTIKGRFAHAKRPFESTQISNCKLTRGSQGRTRVQRSVGITLGDLFNRLR
jgi:hypothetical protein